MRTSEELRSTALDLIDTAIRAAEPGACVARHLGNCGDGLVVGIDGAARLRPAQVAIVAFGKAAAGMAAAASGIVGARLSGGVVVVPRGTPAEVNGLTIIEAGHPLPDAGSVRAAHALGQLLGRQGPESLVLALISGGGSSLLAAPAPGLTLEDKRAAVTVLLAAGLRIDELNAVRKHLSAVKGGNLLRRLHGAPLVSLLLSDVVGDRPDVIASGPLSPDASTFADAWGVVTTHGLETKLPPAIVAHLRQGLDGRVRETLKPGEVGAGWGTSLIVGSNRLSLQAAERRARSLGWNTWVIPEPVVGGAATAGRRLGELIHTVKAGGGPVRAPACILGGGETTVRVDGAGRGGRNQEVAVAAAQAMSGLAGVVVASVGTDGVDGPTDAAGGLVSGSSAELAARRGLDAAGALTHHDTYAFLEAANGLIRTGATGTNVMDLQLLLVSE